MPRVGSSRISSRGSVASQRASSTFCWLPPDSRPIGVSMSAVLMPSALDEALGQLRLLGARQERAQHAEARLQRQRDVLAHRQLGDDAVVLRSSGHSARPWRDRVGRRGEAHAARRRRAARRCRRGPAPNSRRASSVRPEPSRPARPTTSPARSPGRAGAAGPRWPGRAPRAAPARARRPRGAAARRRRSRRQLAPDHRRRPAPAGGSSAAAYSPTARRCAAR